MTKEHVTCPDCERCWVEGNKPLHHAQCPSAPKVTHRMRRGKLVEIPEKWRGQVTYKQTKNKRQPVSRRTRKTKP